VVRSPVIMAVVGRRRLRSPSVPAEVLAAASGLGSGGSVHDGQAGFTRAAALVPDQGHPVTVHVRRLVADADGAARFLLAHERGQGGFAVLLVQRAQLGQREIPGPPVPV
jgi:hypothetical protein